MPLFRRMNSFINTHCFHLRSKVRSVFFMFQIPGTVSQVNKDGNMFEMHALKPFETEMQIALCRAVGSSFICL